MTAEEFLAFIKVCDYRARCYVQGSAYHEKLKNVQPLSGAWSVHFRTHPRVMEAEAEGWSRDLRAAVTAECKRRLISGQDLGNPDDLMPTVKDWWTSAREKARKEKLGTAYQLQTFSEEKAAPRATLRRVDREAWKQIHGEGG